METKRFSVVTFCKASCRPDRQLFFFAGTRSRNYFACKVELKVKQQKKRTRLEETGSKGRLSLVVVNRLSSAASNTVADPTKACTRYQHTIAAFERSKSQFYAV